MSRGLWNCCGINLAAKFFLEKLVEFPGREPPLDNFSRKLEIIACEGFLHLRGDADLCRGARQELAPERKSKIFGEPGANERDDSVFPRIAATSEVNASRFRSSNQMFIGRSLFPA